MTVYYDPSLTNLVRCKSLQILTRYQSEIVDLRKQHRWVVVVNAEEINIIGMKPRRSPQISGECGNAGGETIALLIVMVEARGDSQRSDERLVRWSVLRLGNNYGLGASDDRRAVKAAQRSRDLWSRQILLHTHRFTIHGEWVQGSRLSLRDCDVTVVRLFQPVFFHLSKCYQG